MEYFQFNKLVRDKIIENMIESGQELVGEKVLNKEEFIAELKIKLGEEVDEFLKENDPEKMKEELADVFEVMEYIMEELGMSKTDLEEYKKRKLQKYGGFEKRLYLESLGVEEDNEWYEYYINKTDAYPVLKET